MRLTMSVPPPALKPTMTWIGWSAGHSAKAGTAAAKVAPARTAAKIARFIGILPWPGASLRCAVMLAPRERVPAHACQAECCLWLLVFDRIAQHPDARDLDFADIARLHPDRFRLARMADAGRRAGEDDVAGL